MINGKIRFVYWKEEKFWIGYLEEFPDYLTQAESFEELQVNLKDLYSDLTSGKIPFVRKIAELEVA
jgi:hypothetical protein